MILLLFAWLSLAAGAAAEERLAARDSAELVATARELALDGFIWSARYLLAEVLRRGAGEAIYGEALAGVEWIGDGEVDGEIVHLVEQGSGVPPKEARGFVGYVLARRAVRDGDLGAAQSFLEDVPRASAYRERAMTLLGDVRLGLHEERLALRAWRNAVRASDSREGHDRGLLNMARLYDTLGWSRNAAAYLTGIDERSPFWGDALYARAQALSEVDPPWALGLVYALHQSDLGQRVWMPGLHEVEAEAYAALCYAAEAAAARAAHRASATARGEELDRWWAAHADAAMGRRGSLPAALAAHLDRDPEIARFARGIEEGVRELKKLRRSRRSTVRRHRPELAAAVRERLEATTRAADEVVRERVDAVRAHLRRDGGAGEPAPADVELGPGRDWAFRGEIWPDEIEGLRVTLASRCPRR